jgi:hypothetical protein
MKDFPMFNKLFFVLCSSLLIAVSSPSAAEEPTYHTIQGSGGEYEVFGTKQEALRMKKTLSNNKTKRLQEYIKTAERFRDRFVAKRAMRTTSRNVYHDVFARRIVYFRNQIQAEERKITAPLGAKRERQYKLRKARENEAAAKQKREEEEARIKEAIRKQQLEKKISSVLKIIAGIKNPKDANKITSITKDGLVRTIYCNPGPCTPGSVKLHEYITGIDMGVDVRTLARRIKTNAAQKKRQDNTNENNAKTAEDMASLGNVSVDTLFEQSEADLDKTNDTSFARAQSIPLAQRIKNREAYTDYVRSAAENEAYCLYEGGC